MAFIGVAESVIADRVALLTLQSGDDSEHQLEFQS